MQVVNRLFILITFITAKTQRDEHTINVKSALGWKIAPSKTLS